MSGDEILTLSMLIWGRSHCALIMHFCQSQISAYAPLTHCTLECTAWIAIFDCCFFLLLPTNGQTCRVNHFMEREANLATFSGALRFDFGCIVVKAAGTELVTATGFECISVICYQIDCYATVLWWTIAFALRGSIFRSIYVASRWSVDMHSIKLGFIAADTTDCPGCQ